MTSKVVPFCAPIGEPNTDFPAAHEPAFLGEIVPHLACARGITTAAPGKLIEFIDGLEPAETVALFEDLQTVAIKLVCLGELVRRSSERLLRAVEAHELHGVTAGCVESIPSRPCSARA